MTFRRLSSGQSFFKIERSYLLHVVSAIKRRVNAKQGFQEFQAARRTIQGYEAIKYDKQGQVRWVNRNDLGSQIQFIKKLFELPA